MPREKTTPVRDFRGKRWLNVGLRAIHVVGLILLGAGLLSHSGDLHLAVALTMTSGVLMFVIDLWADPTHLREVSGFGIILKLGLIGLMAGYPEFALGLFWLTVILATVLSHAPAHFRHKRLF